jgi:hypothetical protein
MGQHTMATGDYVALTFDQQCLPNVGPAMNRGGWPADKIGFSLLLEP